MTFVQSVVEDQPSSSATAAVTCRLSVEFHWCSIFAFNSMVLLCNTAKETEKTHLLIFLLFFKEVPQMKHADSARCHGSW